MIKGKNIICISQTTWHGEFTKSTVQLLSLLAEHNNIFFVEYPFTLKDVVMSMLGKQKAQVSRMLGFKKRIVDEKTENGAVVKHLVMPPVLPIDFIKNKTAFKFLLVLTFLAFLSSPAFFIDSFLSPSPSISIKSGLAASDVVSE